MYGKGEGVDVFFGIFTVMTESKGLRMTIRIVKHLL